MKNVLYIGNKLNNNKSNVTSISLLGALLEQEGFKLTYASSYSNKVKRLFDMFWTTIKHRKIIDWVIIDTYSTQNFYYAVLISQLCRILRLQYIPILRGGNLTERLKNNPKLCAKVFNNAKQSVSPSLYLKREFESYGFNNVVHIPNTIQICDYTLKTKNYEAPRLLWVRSFSKIYNPKLAIQVYNEVKKSYPKSTLCMVGPDSDGTLKEIQQLALELNLDVEFTGKLTKKEWILVSKNSNIFINTTNFDNTPVSVIEAMALGLPIVSTNVGGLPFLITDSEDGLLVEPQNINAMVDAIMRLTLDNELRNSLILNARGKVENFDWKVVKPKWEILLS